MTSMEIDFLIFPHVEELDVVGAFEIFGKVKDVTKVTDVADAVDISSLKVMASTNITVCAHGLSIVRTHELNPENKGDILVVPGGKGVREHTEGRSMVIEYIQKTYKDYQFIVSVCTGAFLLAEAGALMHITCTTHSQFQEELKLKGYSVVSHRIVHDRKYITST
jgi:transcriptional regulator GlxA family with amidase domain